jgi:circadian clock protein KaiC
MHVTDSVRAPPAGKPHQAGPTGGGNQPVLKKPTGIRGFDEMSGGGLPEGRLTAVMGGPGAGKTVFALQTVMNRLTSRGEAGIVVTFEEPVAGLQMNMSSFDWRMAEARDDRLIFIDARMPADAMVVGAFDLNALLVGLTELQAESGARTVVFDGIDMLLSSLQDEKLERRELARLEEWVRHAGLAAIITVKAVGLTSRDQLRSDFIQYMTDCVIVLNASFGETTSSRSLRIAKYRGSGFAANPVPLVIARSGMEVLSFKGTRTDYPSFADKVSSGIPRLDALLGGGYARGSSILISGSPGTSKTSLSANFAVAACASGERALFVSFDESGAQIAANMRSIGLDLSPHVESGDLIMVSLISAGRSPEEHFVTIRNAMEVHAPRCLIIDPLSALLNAHYPFSSMISESLIDIAKGRGVTVLCTSLLGQVSGDIELSASHVSTLADTWIHVSYIAEGGERNRALTIIKSRGTAHSNQVRELLLTHTGVQLSDVYIAEGRVLMGSARAQKEAEAERLQALAQLQHEQATMQLEQTIAELAARSASVMRDLRAKQKEAQFLATSEQLRATQEASTALTRIVMRTAVGDSADADPAILGALE